MSELTYRVWDLDGSDCTLERTIGNLAPYRKLWDEIFADPEGFADYYFKEVCKNNIIIGVYDADTLIGMAYANPYQIMDASVGSTQASYYIVGVAVDEAYRKQGIMRKMMQSLMEYLKEKDCQFVFLMPENEKYYMSLDFESIYKSKTITFDTVNYEFDMPLDPTVKVLHLSRLPKEEWQLLADGINKKLAEVYGYYVNRSCGTLEAMLAEHSCQKGDVAIVYDDENVRSVFAYGLNGKHMYIERFELFGEAYGEMLAKVMVRVARFMKCEMCSVTLDERYAQAVSSTFADGCEIENGHGIMACSLVGDAFSIEKMKNTSFFDEII